jgi:hypothetical protein
MYSQPSPSPSSHPSSPTLSQDADLRHSDLLEKRRRRYRTALHILIGLVAGIVVGVVGFFLVLLSITSGSPGVTPASQGVNGNLTLTVLFSQAYLTKLAQQHINGAGLPGSVSNVQVKTTHNAPIVITADDQIGILGLTVSRPLTADVQPYVQSCRVHMHVTHADLGGVSLASYASSLENQLNQQLTINSSTLPHGFTYCATGVSTENSGVLVTFTATPTK